MAENNKKIDGDKKAPSEESPIEKFDRVVDDIDSNPIFSAMSGGSMDGAGIVNVPTSPTKDILITTSWVGGTFGSTVEGYSALDFKWVRSTDAEPTDSEIKATIFNHAYVPASRTGWSTGNKNVPVIVIGGSWFTADGGSSYDTFAPTTAYGGGTNTVAGIFIKPHIAQIEATTFRTNSFGGTGSFNNLVLTELSDGWSIYAGSTTDRMLRLSGDASLQFLNTQGGTLRSTLTLQGFDLTVSGASKTLAGAGTTLTLGGNLTTSGAFNLTFTITANENITIPAIASLTMVGAESGTWTQYGVPYASNATNGVVQTTGAGASGQPLVGTGASAPAFGNVNVGSYATGILGTANGGTNSAITGSAIADGDLLLGDATNDRFNRVTIGATSVLSTTSSSYVTINSTASAYNLVVYAASSGSTGVANQLAAWAAGKLSTNATSFSSNELVTKAYVDGVSSGLDVKPSVRVSTIATLTATYANGSSGVGATLTNSGVQAAISIDGVSLSLDDRVLVKDQSTPAQNGIYYVTTVGSGASNWVLTRALDADTSAEFNSGAFTFVSEGTQADSGWVMTQDSTITFGTTDITWSQFSGAGSITNGRGLGKAGNTIYSLIDQNNQTQHQFDLIGGGGASTSSTSYAGTNDLTLRVSRSGAGTAQFTLNKTISGNWSLSDGSHALTMTAALTVSTISTLSLNSQTLTMSASMGNLTFSPGSGTTATTHNLVMSGSAQYQLSTATGTFAAGDTYYNSGTSHAAMTRLTLGSAGGVMYVGSSVPAWSAGSSTQNQIFTMGTSSTPAWGNLDSLVTVTNGRLTKSGTQIVDLDVTLSAAFPWTGAHTFGRTLSSGVTTNHAIAVTSVPVGEATGAVLEMGLTADFDGTTDAFSASASGTYIGISSAAAYAGHFVNFGRAEGTWASKFSVSGTGAVIAAGSVAATGFTISGNSVITSVTPSGGSAIYGALTLAVGGGLTIGQASQTITISAAANTVTGSGSNNQVTYWTGTNTIAGENQLAFTRGGTGSDLTSAGGTFGVVYKASSSTLFVTAQGASNNLLIGNGSSAPTFTTLSTLTTQGNGISLSGTTNVTVAVNQGFGFTWTAQHSYTYSPATGVGNNHTIAITSVPFAQATGAVIEMGVATAFDGSTAGFFSGDATAIGGTYFAINGASAFVGDFVNWGLAAGGGYSSKFRVSSTGAVTAASIVTGSGFQISGNSVITSITATGTIYGAITFTGSNGVTVTNAGNTVTVAGAANTVTGTGTTHTLPRWSGTSTLADSMFKQNSGATVGTVGAADSDQFNIGNAAPSSAGALNLPGTNASPKTTSAFGIVFGGDSNVTLYRSAASTLRTGASLTADGTLSAATGSFVVDNTAGTLGQTTIAYAGSGSATALVIKSRAADDDSTTVKLIEFQTSGGAGRAHILADGTFRAPKKSFDIPHPTKAGMRLVYGVLEGPEHGVYHRDTICAKGIARVELPEYWSKLVPNANYTIALTGWNGKSVTIVEKDECGFTVKLKGLFGRFRNFKFDYQVIGCREEIEFVEEKE